MTISAVCFVFRRDFRHALFFFKTPVLRNPYAEGSLHNKAALFNPNFCFIFASAAS